MTNAPNRYEKFVVPEGTKKIQYVKDTKVPNAARFIIEREDHTAGNLIRMELHRDPNVVFSGYRIPHPLDPRVWVQVQTNGNSNPMQAMDAAMVELLEEFRNVKLAFNEEVEKNKFY